jgi:non-lysosomal glucosylceramidase
MSVPGLGIPLGGVGTGSFHYNLFGTFGPWNMGGSQSSKFWEMRTLPQAAFHIREEVEGAAPTVKTLATRHDNIAPQRNFGGVLPAWNQLIPGDGTYAALYSFGGPPTRCSSRTCPCGSGHRLWPTRTSAPRCRWPSSI